MIFGEQEQRPSVLGGRNLGIALGVHVAFFALFFLFSALHGLFNKKETVLYVKDGVINTSARQAFAAAYVWDEEKSDYVPVPSGIYRKGGEGLGGHIEGSGEVRVGKLGLVMTIR